MSNISFLGCGKMGSNMIKSLASAGQTLTIWNRSSEKSHSLSGENVTPLDSLEDALKASPIIMISVLGYEPACELLENHGSILENKIVLQLSNGKPKDAKKLNELVVSFGGKYIDGAVGGYPSQVASQDLQILYSGNQEAFNKIKPLLEIFGNAIFISENPSSASTLVNASLFAAIPMLVGLCQGVKFCETEKFPVEVYEEFIKKALPAVVNDTLVKAKDKNFSSDTKRVQATLTQVVLEARQFVEMCNEIGTDPGMFKALENLWAKGVADGLGNYDWTYSAEI
ncbi:MAG TPA: NAD(P)-binding domain-containing protein [Victivallales bacterium]|nr:NAD(P)-binding domain-containing protein [Victivallales bacterium]